MSLYDYTAAREIVGLDKPFCAVVMAAMRQADTTNAAKLRAAFPEVWDELQARYDAPGGYLPTEYWAVWRLRPEGWAKGGMFLSRLGAEGAVAGEDPRLWRVLQGDEIPSGGAVPPVPTEEDQ